MANANIISRELNHYSDYGGVVEQSPIRHNGSVSIEDNPFGYSDEYTDNESGLQYLQIRYYDPAIMRFTAMDTYPLLNRYAYADENPIMNDDPSGHNAVGATQSNSADSDEAISGTTESFIGLIAGAGLMFVGLMTTNIGIPLSIVNATSGFAGMFSWLSSNGRVKEGLSIYSLVASTMAGVMDIGTATYRYNRPIKMIDLTKILGDGSFEYADNSTFLTTAHLQFGKPNCLYRNTVVQDFLVTVKEGGYLAKDADENSYAMDGFIRENATYPGWVKVSDYESEVLSKVGRASQGQMKVIGVMMRPKYIMSVGHLTTLLVDDQGGMFFLESTGTNRIQSLSDLAGRFGWSEHKKLLLSFYEVGIANPEKLAFFAPH